MTEHADETSGTSVSDQAAEWLLRMTADELSVAERYAFLQWLKTSPVHIAEFLRMCRLYSHLHAHNLPPFVSEEIYSNVIQLARERGLHRRVGERSRSRARIAVAAAMLGLMVLMGLAGKVSWFDHLIVTEASEWRSLTLTDGSSLSVGPRTRLRNQFGERARVVHLSRGGLMVNVAKDPARPFSIDAGVAIITAKGTQFAVERGAQQATITVAEGTVEVLRKNGGSGASGIAVSAGQQLVVSETGSTHIQQVNPERELAWTERRLDFETETVLGAAAQFNRFNRIQLVIDPALASKPVFGGFHADNPESFARSVAERWNADVVRDTSNVLRVQPRRARE